MIKTWSRSQRKVATSSGEAELYAANRTAQELIGIQSLAKDMGVAIGCKLLLDAKATIGMVSRRGAGRLRHIEVQELWLQTAIAEKRVQVEKVPSWKNVADMMTKHVHPEAIQRHLHEIQVSRY